MNKLKKWYSNMNKLKKWYSDLLWKKPFILLPSVALLTVLCVSITSTHFMVQRLRIFGISLCVAEIILGLRCFKITDQGIYCTLAGIPYRFISWKRVSSICVAQAQKSLILITLGKTQPYAVYKKQSQKSCIQYHRRYPLTTLTIRYSTQNAAIIMSFYKKPFEKGDSLI